MLRDELARPAARNALAERVRTANSFRELLDVARQSGAAALLASSVSALVSSGVPAALATTSLDRLSGGNYRALSPEAQASLVREVRRHLQTHLERAAQEDPAADLSRWAREAQVADLLDGPLPHLYPVADALYRGGARAKGTAAHTLAVLARLPVSELRHRAFGAVRGWLEQEAATRRAALEEQRDPRFSAPPRPEGVLGELSDALGRLREQLLPVRSLPQACFDAVPRLKLEPLHLEVDLRPRKAMLPPVRVDLVLEQWRERLVATCTCEAGERCPHRVLAVERARLDLKALDEDHHGRLSALLAQPAWERALGLLSAPSVPQGSNEPLLFVVDEEDGFVAGVDVHQKGPKSKKPTGRKVSFESLRGLPLTATEQRAVEWLSVSSELDDSYGYYPRGAAVDADSALYRALQELAGHPRVVNGAGQRLEVTECRPTLRVQEVDGGYRLGVKPPRALAALGAEALKRVERLLATGPKRCAAVVEGRCLLVDRPVAAGQLLEAVGRFGNFFPLEAGPVLWERLEALAGQVTLELPEGMTGEAAQADVRPVVGLRLLDDGGLELKLTVRPLEGGAQLVAGEGPARAYLSSAERRQFAVRDFDAELKARAEVAAALGLVDRPEVGVPAERAVDVVAALDGLGATVHVEWSGAELKRTRAARPQDMTLALRKRRDWFGVEGRVSVDGVDVVLDELLLAVRAGRRQLRVSRDRSLTLSDELRSRLTTLSGVAHPVGGGHELSLAALPVLQELTQGFAGVEAPEEWLELARKLSEARAEPAPLPDGLTVPLRDYQHKGFEWLAALGAWGAGACLADDMGLGKTVQALAVLLHRAAEGPALVVAPTSVCGNWLNEASRFAPSLEMRLHHGVERDRALEELQAGHVVVTSYGVLVRDAAVLAELRFSTVVFDEAHALKNPSTQRAQAARRLKAGFRLALTGTPLENRLGELWSLFRVVQPGLLGSEEWFRERFVRPIEGVSDASARAALASIIRPFLLRRLKREVAKELPERTETTVSVEPSPRERARYEEERRLTVAELEHVDYADEAAARLKVFAALTRLRLLACHPRLVDAEWAGGSAKLEHLLELVDALKAEGHKVLVFSQFVKLLALVRPALEERGVKLLQLDGSTPQAERVRRVERFQAGEADVFLLSIKAGGVGLNLTAATYVVHLDPWWNPAVEDQATDRAHRIGQTQPVTVYRLVTAGTVEEKILALHAEKRALVEGVLDGTGAAGALSPAELLELVKGGVLASRAGAPPAT